MPRPEKTEYAPYYEGYVSLADTDDITGLLESQVGEMRDLIAALPEEKGTYSYAEGKWTIKELLGHIIDGELGFMYRAWRFSRGDDTPLEGFDQDVLIEHARFNSRTFASFLDEFEALRRANVIAFSHYSEDDWSRFGTANETRASTRAIAYIMAGHVAHHLNILRTRYLAG